MGRFLADQAAAEFRARGLKVTAQRMAVFGALERAVGHPTAEELHGDVREAVPGFALKTVYAILRELSTLGFVETLPLPSGAMRWETNTTPHAHFVCNGCGRIIDLPIDPMTLLSLAQRTSRRLRMLRPHLLVRGRCDRCSRS
ncbi:MAG TPA: Fur family transcriptional regulator [bacterium]|nr:Fur family transcriptional regulator [bacterium]